MGKRGRKATNGITFVPQHEMKPFLFDIKGCFKEAHVAMVMYRTELIANGYSQDDATEKLKEDTFKICDEIIKEDTDRIL